MITKKRSEDYMVV